MSTTLNMRRLAESRVILTAAFAVMTLFLVLQPLEAQSSSKGAAYELQNTFRKVSADVLPVVVEVSTVNVVERSSGNPFEFFFQFPFGPHQDESPFEIQPFRQEGLGSGVIVEKRKNVVYVLTNNHVVEGAEEINIKFHDGREFTGELVGGDSLRDLALVSFKTKEEVPVARLGDSDELWVGDWVLAIGNPLGLESTVTAGIVSAKGRYDPGQGLTDYIQTDASINRGNSGGALVNLSGEVIGINTWIASPGGMGSVGLGFAIPINNVRRSIEEFITKGSVDYAWLGVNMGNAGQAIVEEMGLKNWEGAFIFNVYGDSPAMKSGIQPGDLIVSVAGYPIRNSDDLSRSVTSMEPGHRIAVEVIRNNRKMALNVTLAVRTMERDGLKVNVWPGFTTAPITKELRDQMRIPRSAGNVLIGEVVDDSPAAVLGLRGGDVIKSINRRSVRNLNQFYQVINSERRLELKIVRQGHELEFILNK